MSEEEQKKSILIDLRQADANYKSFPSFQDWSKCNVDTTRWDRYASLLQQRGDPTPELLKKAQAVATKAAAIDTGAIEGLYDVDRGFTFTVATETAAWENALNAKGSQTRALIESQLKAYDFVLDFATKKQPIVEAWIRELHTNICAAQETYNVYTEVGLQTQKLPLGEYKHLSNHVRTRSEKIHSYAPVDVTPTEMARFCEELRSDAFQKAHPTLQASYAHYAFVAIHPFADGNGRVARALASVFTYRSNSIPLLIYSDQRIQYYSSLEAADNGELQIFVNYTLERILDALQLVTESLLAATAPLPSDSREIIKTLYVTKGGYSQNEVDRAGETLVEAVIQELRSLANENKVSKQLDIDISAGKGGSALKRENYRDPIHSKISYFHINFYTYPPVNAGIDNNYTLVVPKDCGKDDDILLINKAKENDTFTARVNEILPTMTTALQIRISIFCQRIIGENLDRLYQIAARTLKN